MIWGWIPRWATKHHAFQWHSGLGLILPTPILGVTIEAHVPIDFSSINFCLSYDCSGWSGEATLVKHHSSFLQQPSEWLLIHYQQPKLPKIGKFIQWSVCSWYLVMRRGWNWPHAMTFCHPVMCAKGPAVSLMCPDKRYPWKRAFFGRLRQFSFRHHPLTAQCYCLRPLWLI